MPIPLRALVAAAATGLLLAAALAVTPGTAVAASAAVRNGKVAFARANQIYTINPDGTGVRQLTTTATGKSYAPRWSPDGTRIAFVNEPAAGQRHLDLMNADGTGKVRVTNTVISGGAPAWSPNGTTLAFGGPCRIPGTTLCAEYGINRFQPSWTLDHIKATARNGTPTTYAGDEPQYGRVAVGNVDGTIAWSKRGVIAYYSSNWPDASDHYLLTYQVIGGRIDEVAQVGSENYGDGYFADPAFTPSGTGLAYQAQVTEVGSPTDTPHIVECSSPSTCAGFPHVAHDGQPRFSPTGTRIVFENDAAGPKVFTASVTGSGRTLLTTGYSPDWQPTH